jgi:small subunit ribosomal protein S6
VQLHEYESVVIIRPDLDDADTYAIVEKVEKILEDNGGKLLIRDDWGKRKMAYVIQKHLKGHYVLFSHLSPAELNDELERNIRNEDRVIRFMTVLIDRDVDVPERMAQAKEERARREAEAKARAEADALRAAEEAEREARAAEMKSERSFDKDDDDNDDDDDDDDSDDDDDDDDDDGDGA